MTERRVWIILLVDLGAPVRKGHLGERKLLGTPVGLCYAIPAFRCSASICELFQVGVSGKLCLKLPLESVLRESGWDQFQKLRPR